VTTPAPVTRTCAKCGDPFDARRPHTRFCSARCRVAASRETRNEVPVTHPANVVELRPHLVERAVTQEPALTDGDSEPVMVKPRCPCCWWRQLQAVPVAEITNCEQCGYGWRVPEEEQ